MIMCSDLIHHFQIFPLSKIPLIQYPIYESLESANRMTAATICLLYNWRTVSYHWHGVSDLSKSTKISLIAGMHTIFIIFLTLKFVIFPLYNIFPAELVLTQEHDSSQLFNQLDKSGKGGARFLEGLLVIGRLHYCGQGWECK